MLIGKVVGIAVKKASRAPMVTLNNAEIRYLTGLEGDHRGPRTMSTGARRQVTLISEEQWLEACAELEIKLPWYSRRANICISGHKFGPEDVGKALLVGGAKLTVTKETLPCSRMDEIHSGLRHALRNWRGGVCCRVEHGSYITIGDEVRIL